MPAVLIGVAAAGSHGSGEGATRPSSASSLATKPTLTSDILIRDVPAGDLDDPEVMRQAWS
jgi:hypothetical protein